MPDELDDQTHASLLGAVRDPNDGRAWAAFEARYAGLIRGWCRARGLQPGDADDLTQIVLLRLFKTMPDFVYDPAKGFRKWLRAVVDHAVKDFWRHRRRHPGDRGRGDSDAGEALAALPAPGAADLDEVVGTLEEQLERDRRLREAFERARARVEPRTWEAFLLTAVEGLSGREAAGRLGMEVAAVYVAKGRVLRKLRDEVGGLV